MLATWCLFAIFLSLGCRRKGLNFLKFWKAYKWKGLERREKLFNSAERKREVRKGPSRMKISKNSSWIINRGADFHSFLPPHHLSNRFWKSRRIQLYKIHPGYIFFSFSSSGFFRSAIDSMNKAYLLVYKRRDRPFGRWHTHAPYALGLHVLWLTLEISGALVCLVCFGVGAKRKRIV